MKIIINHNQDTIDPGATYPDTKFEEVLERLEDAYSEAVHAIYPDAEIEFGDDVMRPVRVVTPERDDPPYDIEADVIGICANVFEAGLFWL